jgi:OmpA family
MYLHTGEQFGQVRTAPPAAPIAVLDQFDFDRSALKPAHLPEIDRVAKLVISSQTSSDPITTVTLIGHTDSVGPANYNRALGLRRAHGVQAQLRKRIDDLKPGLSARVKLVADTRGEAEPRPGSPARSRRVEIFVPRSVVPPPPPPSTTTRDVKIVVKSYIAPIVGRTGATVCSRFDPISALKLRALATATDAAFSENPLTDVKDKKYRLFTSRLFRVVCSSGKIVGVTPSGLDIDTGLECIPRTTLCLTPPPMTVISSSLTRTGPASFSFFWKAKGRPPRQAEPGFQLVCPRTSWFIWHSVEGTLDCSGPSVRVSTRLTGSHFPSHRLFLDGASVTTIPQGSFSDLWVPRPGDITMVA